MAWLDARLEKGDLVPLSTSVVGAPFHDALSVRLRETDGQSTTIRLRRLTGFLFEERRGSICSVVWLVSQGTGSSSTAMAGVFRSMK